MILRQTLKRGGAAVVACVGLAGLMISCDSDFDLSNINTDITVGGSIAAPIGTTDTLTLSRLIDLTDNLKVDENGAYALTSNGSTVLDIDRIDHVQIKDLSTTPEYFNFSVPSIPGTLPTLDLTTPMSVTMMQKPLPENPEVTGFLFLLSVSLKPQGDHRNGSAKIHTKQKVKVPRFVPQALFHVPKTRSYTGSFR